VGNIFQFKELYVDKSEEVEDDWDFVDEDVGLD